MFGNTNQTLTTLLITQAARFAGLNGSLESCGMAAFRCNV